MAKVIYRYKLLVVAGHFFICASLLFFAAPAAAESPPPYSVLYDTLLKLERQEAFVAAIRVVPEIYKTEIVVDAFYTTLQNKRQQLFTQINSRNIQFLVGSRKMTCTDILPLFNEYFLEKSAVHENNIPRASDLSFDRFCNLLITEGHLQPTSSTDSLLFPSSSQFNLQSALNSADPWLVSAAIFFAGKQKTPTISPQAIINRWENRPDLWDEDCTRQSLSFFDRLDLLEIKALQISNEDIRLELESITDPSR